VQYRRFGNLDFSVSALGFGAMRLPVKGGKVDEPLAIAMIRNAVDHGVNYVDTAYPYHEGTSEVIVGRALRNGYRERVKVATKLPSWEVKTAADFDRFLDLQLKRLQMDSVDFYLLHSLNKNSWAKLRDLGVISWAEKAIAKGRFHHLAFSYHDDAPTFLSIVDAYPWSMCQVQYNFMDIENGPGTAGVRHAASRGIAVVVMEPLLGGKLVAPPAAIQEIWNGAARKRSAVGWALEWLWDQPEIATVLSGMSAPDQVEENLALARQSRVGSLTPEEQALYPLVRARYNGLSLIPCTNCGYCMPCPHGVDIPGNFAAYNQAIMYDKQAASRGQYAWWKTAFEVTHIFDSDLRALRCEQCDECLEKCPQSIPISTWMPAIHTALGENGPFVTKVNAP
jgi:predicted aldo/keto reductase-like oxidoreductase